MNKKFTFFVIILLVVVLGLLWYVKREVYESEKAGKADEASEIIESDGLDSSAVLQTSFLDIGQGDATFIEFPDGRQMLVDCGKDARILEALGRVMDFYDHQIDYLLVTHPDLDHYGGCTDVLKRFDVKNIIHNGLEKNSDEMWVEFWQTVLDEDAEYFEMKQEEKWEIASTTLHFLYPDQTLTGEGNSMGSIKKANDNNTSIVFKLSFGEVDFLFTGDAEAELEKYLTDRYADQLDVEILKAGHHGSGTSSIEEFLALTTPSSTIISAGYNNRYGHPSRRVLKRLERVGSKTWRTDLQGDIIVSVNKDGGVIID